MANSLNIGDTTKGYLMALCFLFIDHISEQIKRYGIPVWSTFMLIVIPSLDQPKVCYIIQIFVICQILLKLLTEAQEPRH